MVGPACGRNKPRSRRRGATPTAPWGAPALDQDPWISADGRHLFFASNCSGQMAIYESTR